jgi:hypothetical protein
MKTTVTVLALVALVTAALAQNPNNPYANGTIEHACHDGNVAACTRWRERECRAGNRAACDYYVARKKKDPGQWCADQYPNDAASYRFCLNGSPDR